MGGSAHASLSAGIVILAGGVFAYVSKGSLPSLLGSSVIGGGLIAGGLLILNGRDFQGHALSAATSILLVGVAAQRYSVARKSMPAIPMFVIGAISSAYHIKKVIEWS